MQDIGNIVIVDDNPNNLAVLGEILRQEAFKVRPALTGALALRAIFAQPPDLVLLDIRMPDMDGYATCRALKSNPATADLPVIFISALNAIEDKLEAFQAGGVDYLTKPFQPEEVLARVRTHIDLARARRALAESNARLQTLMDDLVLTEKLRSLGALAAGMAHELNTPIGNAMLAASTIEETLAALKSDTSALGEPWQSCYDCSRMVMRSLERANRLIETMKEMTVDRDSERRRIIKLKRTLG
ncbi:MAG TPA: response regulator, partial [Rhodocyclaceae bacterium]|nr:response regulator [Rhodocyclaceae bacterium]